MASRIAPLCAGATIAYPQPHVPVPSSLGAWSALQQIVSVTPYGYMFDPDGSGAILVSTKGLKAGSIKVVAEDGTKQDFGVLLQKVLDKKREVDAREAAARAAEEARLAWENETRMSTIRAPPSPTTVEADTRPPKKRKPRARSLEGGDATPTT